MIQDLELLPGWYAKLSCEIIATSNPFVVLDGEVRGCTWRNFKRVMLKKMDFEIF